MYRWHVFQFSCVELVVVLGILGGVVGDVAQARSEWSDDFESYEIGTFPSSGGWVLQYGGAGTAYQYVDDTQSVSGGKSLHLMGSYAWSGEAYCPVAFPESSQVTAEARVRVDEIVGCGTTQTIAGVGLTNPNLGAWGTHYGFVRFGCDGYIAACIGTYPIEAVQLMPFQADTWYRVGLVVDLRSRTFSVFVDGLLQGGEFPILDDGNPTAVEVCAAHGSPAPIAWFDDVESSFSYVVLSGEVLGEQVVLSWPSVQGASDYWIYGVPNQPWFVPGSAPGYEYRLTVLPSTITTWSSSSGVGDPNANWTYLVMAVDVSGQELARSNRVGEADVEGNIP